MTPERIEEIELWYRVADKGQLIKYVHDLLAALEESQQQIKELQEGNRSACESRDMAYRSRDEAIVTSNQHYKQAFFLNEGLIEAQQTIARQQKVIDWYESGGSMGELVEEGSDKA